MGFIWQKMQLKNTYSGEHECSAQLKKLFRFINLLWSSISLSLVCYHMKLFDITISWSFYYIKVGTTAANGDRKIGQVVAKAMGRFGNERLFIVSVS